MKEGSKSIRDRAGIDYLLTPHKPQPQPAPVEPGIDNAIADQVRLFRQVKQLGTVLGKLQECPDHKARLYELVDATGLELPELLQLTNNLEKRQFVRIIERDKLGNYLVQLTSPGHDFLESLR